MTEPNSSDSRGERLDFFLKQEETLATESGFLGANESEEASGGGGGGGISSVANLKAALMSKNSLLSLRAEMMGDDNPLLYEYLPKGGHSLSCKYLFTEAVLTLLVSHIWDTPSNSVYAYVVPPDAAYSALQNPLSFTFELYFAFYYISKVYCDTPKQTSEYLSHGRKRIHGFQLFEEVWHAYVFIPLYFDTPK